MKKLDLGQTLGILANVGVIAGIVFLGFELRQNNQLMEAESRAARAERTTTLAEMVSSNLDLASAIAKVRAGETLSPSEEVLIYSFYIRRFRGMEAYFVEFQAGTVESIDVADWKLIFGNDPWTTLSSIDAWNDYKAYLYDDFVQWMEENVVNER